MITRLVGGSYFLIALGVPLALMALLVGLVKSPVFVKAPDVLATGVVVDLVFSIPLIYFLLIRRRSIPNATVLPWFVLGVGVASLVIPKAHQSALAFVLTWVAPVVEVLVIGYLLTKVWRLLQSAKVLRETGLDVMAALRTASEQALGRRIGGLFASEMAMVYYGLYGGKKAKPGPGVFFYHQKNATTTILWALLALLVVETGLLHLFLIQWNAVVAWSVFALSAYSGVQLLAVVRAFSRRPIVVADGKLHLRFSVLRDAQVGLEHIERVRLSSAPEDGALNLNPLKLLNEHNVVVWLKAPAVLRGMLGYEKPFQTLLLYVDEPKRFQAHVTGLAVTP